MLKPSEKTPVERAADMLEQGLGFQTISLCLGVSETHGRRLVALAKREIKSRQKSRSAYYQRYHLPHQLEAARAKVAVLERKAIRLGMSELVEGRHT